MSPLPQYCANCGGTKLKKVDLNPEEAVMLCERCGFLTPVARRSEAEVRQDLSLQLASLRQSRREAPPAPPVPRWAWPALVVGGIALILLWALQPPASPTPRAQASPMKVVPPLKLE